MRHQSQQMQSLGLMRYGLQCLQAELFGLLRLACVPVRMRPVQRLGNGELIGDRIIVLVQNDSTTVTA